MKKVVFVFAVFLSLNVSWGGFLHGAWSLVEDFNSMPLGGIDGVNGWTAGGNLSSLNVAADPHAAFTNRSLHIQNTSASETRAYKALLTPVAEGTTSTLFLRVRNVETPADMGFGLSDELAPVGFPSFEAQALTTNGLIRVRDNAATPNVKTLSPYTSNIWTNIWMVADNALDTTTLYATVGNANAIGKPFVVGAFRNGTAVALETFLLNTGIGQTTPAYIDDIFLDSSGANLSLPTLTTLVRGDANGDGSVNSIDIEAIQANYDQQVTLRSQGDLNGDGKVNLIDFREWKEHATFGNVVAPLGITVPEPSGIGLLVTFVVMGFGLNRPPSK